MAVSDDRQIDESGRCKTPVGNTVDVERATWSNTIGDPEMLAVWTDPDFDPSQRAFYYVRVIEIPTPRWTAYEAKRFRVKMDDNVPMITTERAYTSRFGIRQRASFAYASAANRYIVPITLSA